MKLGNAADIFIKPLSKRQFKLLSTKFGLVSKNPLLRRSVGSVKLTFLEKSRYIINQVSC